MLLNLRSATARKTEQTSSEFTNVLHGMSHASSASERTRRLITRSRHRTDRSADRAEASAARLGLMEKVDSNQPGFHPAHSKSDIGANDHSFIRNWKFTIVQFGNYSLPAPFVEPCIGRPLDNYRCKTLGQQFGNFSQFFSTSRVQFSLLRARAKILVMEHH